jgi:ATP-dependent RNA helicase DDX5/DBP2
LQNLSLSVTVTVTITITTMGRGKRKRTQRKQEAALSEQEAVLSSVELQVKERVKQQQDVVKKQATTAAAAAALPANDGTDASAADIPAAFEASIVRNESTDEKIVTLQTCWKRLETRKSKTWTPTSIQLQSWPILMHAACDLIGIAATGSGKTLAYGLAMAANAPARFKGVYGLVLVPTRELANQVEKELQQAAKHVQVFAIYGGVDRKLQLDALMDNTAHKPKLVAATPGRLVDLWKDCTGQLDHIEFVVLDEADRMASNLDMSQQVDQILKFLIKKPRVCLYSATMPRSVREKWRDWIQKPTAIVKVDTMMVGKELTTEDEAIALAEEAGPKDEDGAKPPKRPRQGLESAQIPAHVTQILHVCSAHKKPKKLLSTLAKIRKDDIGSRQRSLCLVFFSRIKTLQYVNKLLSKEGIVCAELHSQMKQDAREKTLANFRAGKIDTLLASDIAARGIHVANVQYVVNYDFPTSLDQYVHRCGRAGRSQVTGSTEPSNKATTVYSFFNREMEAMAKDVVALLRDSKAWLDPNLLELAGEGEGGKRSKRKKDKATPVEKKAPGEENEDDWDDGQFASLNPSRIVLKRASHVSDASEDDDDECEE